MRRAAASTRAIAEEDGAPPARVRLKSLAAHAARDGYHEDKEEMVGPEGVQNSLKTNDIFCLTY